MTSATPGGTRSRWRRILALTGSILARIVLAVPSLVAFGAVLAPGGRAATILAALFGIASVAALVFVRPLWKAAAVSLGLFAVVLLWFISQRPRLDRDWQVDVSRAPRVAIDGDLVTVKDVRDFDWTGADTANPRWHDRTFDLSKLESLWLVLSYWDGNTAICHTMLSFGFSDGAQLAVSVEARKEVGEEYSAWRGFFHQYELFYDLAEERDVIGVRAVHRAEDLYMYRLRVDAAARRRLLEDILRTAGALADTPQWYGALRSNCTTTLQRHIDDALGRPHRFRFDTMLNGSIDEKGWRAGSIENDRPFAEVRAAHRITDAARSAAGRDDFARVVREAIGER